MAELFGFSFKKIKNEEGVEKFTPPTSDDGTIEVAGGGHGQVLDPVLHGHAKRGVPAGVAVPSDAAHVQDQLPLGAL